jgi:hypothetical protein
MRFTPPDKILILKGEMVRKNLSLAEVSKLSGVGYTLCSQILNGRVNDPDRLREIRRAIRRAPKPYLASA